MGFISIPVFISLSISYDIVTATLLFDDCTHLFKITIFFMISSLYWA